MKHIKLFENFEEKLDIPYDFIEEVKDFLLEYEEQNMNTIFSVNSYVNEDPLYYHSSKTDDKYYHYDINKTLKIYQEENIPLNSFLYYIDINGNKELSMKVVNRLKHFYPNINTNVSNYDVKWNMLFNNYKLNDYSIGIYFILE